MKYLLSTQLAFALLLGFGLEAQAASVEGLISRISASSGVSQEAAARQVKTVFSAIEAELAQDQEVSVPQFGRFYLQQRDERQVKHPKTGKLIDVPARRYPRFSSYSSLKQRFNQPGN